jgi:CDP-6-deoxy-D-xylo-4-hexulose-3-dehydrase
MSDIKDEIFKLIKKFFDEKKKQGVISNDSKITVGYPAFDEKEIISALDSLLNLKISQGEKVNAFEQNFSKYIGTKYAVAVNSGSSANLIAISSLIESGVVKKGTEVIVPAATFTTVVSPIIQNGLIPKFVDVEMDTYNIDPNEIEKAIDEKTGLILVVHSFGCPAKMKKIMSIAHQHNLPVMEDCCEAHGAEYKGKKVGSFGDISTYSFFIAHNMTTGEGGIVLTNNEILNDILESVREFGRLKKYEKYKRFYYNDETLKNYDERYVFNKIGYNVRMTDIAASLGIEQLKKLDKLNKRRLQVARRYSENLSKFGDYLILPKIPDNCFHAFYGFVIIVKENSHFNRLDIVRFLEENNIETRGFMGGNLAIQPAYRNENIKISGNLKNTNLILNNAFFIGCHPYISDKQIEHVIKVFEDFFKKYQ